MDLYYKYNKLINLILSFIIISFVATLINNYFKPFLIIILILLVVYPIHKLFLKLKLPSFISAILSILTMSVLLFILIFYFGNRLSSVIYKFYLDNIIGIENIINTIMNKLNLDLNTSIRELTKLVNGSLIMQGVIITGEGIISYFLSNIIVYFILVDKNKAYELLSNIFSKETINKFRNKTRNLKEVIKIEIKLIILSFTIIILGFKVLGISNCLLIGGICAILDIVPFVGTTIVFIPIIIYNIIIKRYLIVIGLVLLYLLERFTREILEAKFLSSKLEIHPVIVIISIYIGVNMFGALGIIAGPIYSIIAKDIIYKY